MDVCPTDGEPTLELLLTRRCTVVMSAILGRREAFERIGSFEEDRRFSEDYDLWLRMVAAGSRIGYQRAPLTRRRIHADNFTRDNSRLAEVVITTLARFAKTHVLSRRERQALDDTLVAARSEIALERMKASLAAGDIAAAKRESRAIDRSRVGWKAQMAMVALVAAPGLLALVYRTRDRSAA
jgi:hypothetical protein